MQTTPTEVTASVDRGGELKIGEGEEMQQLQIKVNVKPETANAKNKVTYSSSNTNVATVDEKGLITAVSEGSADIFVQTENKKQTQLTVNVTGKDLGGMRVESTAITVNNRTIQENYWIYIPKIANIKTYKNIPLIIYLHGAMSDNSDMQAIAEGSLPGYLYYDMIAPNAIVVAPRNPEYEWSPGVVMQIVNRIKQLYDINENKISITGHSYGANGAWRTAASNPNVFSACVPVSCQTNDYMSSVSQFPNCMVRFIYEDYRNKNGN